MRVCFEVEDQIRKRIFVSRSFDQEQVNPIPGFALRDASYQNRRSSACDCGASEPRDRRDVGGALQLLAEWGRLSSFDQGVRESRLVDKNGAFREGRREFVANRAGVCAFHVDADSLWLRPSGPTESDEGQCRR